MLRLWADRLWSVCAGTGLVLLLAAEGNVCPHLLNAPPDSASSGNDPADGAVPARRDSTETTSAAPVPAPDEPAQSVDEPASPAPPQSNPRPPAWSAGWPDTMPARRPWYADRAAQGELAGRRSGTVACGPLNQGRAGQDAAWTEPLPPWRADRFPLPALTGIPLDCQTRAVRNPALLTLLRRTGPPC